MTQITSPRRVTIRDVAAEANVAPSTVSLFMRGGSGVSEETSRRIETAIEKLQYTPRRRGNHRPGPAFVGFVIENLPLPAFADLFYGEIIQALEAQAKAQGYGMLFSVVEDVRIPRMVIENQVAGLFILGGSPINDALAAELARRDIPLVLVDNYVAGLRVDSIVPDNEWGGYAAFKHLIDLGHERIAIIEGPRKYKTLTDRLNGALRAAEDHDLKLSPEYRQGSLSSGHPNKGYREMKQLLTLPEPPTAVFAVSDKTAVGALEAIKEKGLKVPADISLVGFDNVATEHTIPPLTTVHVPKYQMGVLAMERLIDLINDEVQVPVRTSVYTELIVRDSTAPYSGRR